MKRTMRMVLTLLVVLMATALPAHAARGHGGHGGHGGGHVGIGLYVGPGWWGPGWWGPPYYPYYPYYPQPPVIVQPPPEVYVQPEPQEPSYWYFCPDPQGYYPYVKRCPKGWMKVVPHANPPEGEE